MMSDLRTILERGVGGATPPPDGFERMLRRRDRKRRNQRIAAGVVGIAVFVAAVWFVRDVTSLNNTEQTVVPAGSGTTGPAVTEPTYTLGPVTDEDSALGDALVQAWLDGDGEAAAALFSPEGTFDGFPPTILPALLDWFRAGGWTFESQGHCGVGGLGPEEGYVGCDFWYQNDLTRSVGLPPQSMPVHFVTDAAGIKAATSGSFESAAVGMGYTEFDIGVDRETYGGDLFGDVWDSFIEWLSTSHPEDFGRMYDVDHGYPVLDPDSIALWQRYTSEFVALQPGSFTEWLSNQSIEVQARRICLTKTTEFWNTEGSGRDLHGRAFDAALADVSEEILTELRAVPLRTEADRATMEAFVPLAEQWIEFFRQAAEGTGQVDFFDRRELQFSLGEVIDGCLISYGLLG